MCVFVFYVGVYNIHVLCSFIHVCDFVKYMYEDAYNTYKTFAYARECLLLEHSVTMHLLFSHALCVRLHFIVIKCITI